MMVHLVFAILAAATAAPTRVLPLGDSITFGCGDGCSGSGCGDQCAVLRLTCQAGYRKNLWHKLSPDSATSSEWDFVGTQQNGPDDIDRDHEGYPGWKVEDIEGIAAKWAPLHPDVILLHIGTNNLGVGLQSATDALGHLSSLLNTTFSLLPNVRLLLSTLIGSSNFYGGSKHAEYNAGIEQLVGDLSAAGRFIEFVDMASESGLGEKCDTGSCCPMGIHPNEEGYALMADVWYQHLVRTVAV